MQQDKISIDIKLPTKWEDLTDKQLRYVFALLAQGFTVTEVKAYCLHRYGNNDWAWRHGKQTPPLVLAQVLRFGDEYQGVLRGQHRTLVHGHPLLCIIKRFWPQSLKKRSQWPRFSIR
jgi:hypothetical protein